MPGVHAVVTGQGPARALRHHPVDARTSRRCARTKARYVGDAIAAVAADSERLAEEALRAIRVEYEVLPRGHRTSTTALAHPERQVNEKAAEGNISKQVRLEFGAVDAALAQQRRGGRGRVLVRGLDARAHRAALLRRRVRRDGLPHRLVEHAGRRTTCTATSRRCSACRRSACAWCSRSWAGRSAARASRSRSSSAPRSWRMVTGRPVKILYTREEVFYAHRGRHPMRLRYRTGIRARRHADRHRRAGATWTAARTARSGW